MSATENILKLVRIKTCYTKKKTFLILRCHSLNKMLLEIISAVPCKAQYLVLIIFVPNSKIGELYKKYVNKK